MTVLFATAVNRRSGAAKVTRLSDVGTHGNSHFPFTEKNNQEVAKALREWPVEKEFDRRRQKM